jgi:putative membrane protein
MKNIIIKSAFLLLMTGSFFISRGQSRMDAKFAQHAAKDGLMEVQLGRLAQSKAVVPLVKQHAQHMIEDHGKANEELKTLAAKKNISLPTSLDDMMQKKYDKLAKLSGNKFDKKYTKCMVHEHKKAIGLFKKESKHGDDPELVGWATGKIPTLKNHLTMWKEACKTVKKEKKS